MKKTIGALALFMAIGANAQTTSTSISTSTGTVNKTILKKIIENTSVSYYGSYYKNEAFAKDNKTTFYNQLTLSYALNDNASVFVVPRYNLTDDTRGEGTHDTLNPRFGLRAFSFTSGNYSFAPELRYEIAMDDTKGADPETFYGILRIAQNSNYKLNNAVSLNLWASLSENVVKNNASLDDKNTMTPMFDLSVSYSVNDNHGLMLSYFLVSSINENANTNMYSNKQSNDTFYLKYSNSQIDKLTIIPSTYITRDKELNPDNLGLMLELVGRI
jgi:hypothetical protein